MKQVFQWGGAVACSGMGLAILTVAFAVPTQAIHADVPCSEEYPCAAPYICCGGICVDPYVQCCCGGVPTSSPCDSPAEDPDEDVYEEE